MKNVLILLFTLLLCSKGLSQELKLGIKAGANFATITNVTDASTKTGFHAGAFAGLKFGDKIGLQADILYSQQGAEFSGQDFDLTYVNVPVVLKYYLFQGLNIQAGPQFGFVVDDNIKEIFSSISEAENSDVSGIVGVGSDLPFGLVVDGRYNFGFTDVVKGSGKNSVFLLSLGYSFL